MCCNGYAQLIHREHRRVPNSKPNSTATAAVESSETVVSVPLPDGYWTEAFPFSDNAQNMDLIAYGLGFAGNPASIRLFVNPVNSISSGWTVAEIANMEFPVGMTFADLTGDGFNDIIITDRYGPGMGDLWDGQTNNGGRIQWLRNPGNRLGEALWTAHKIGNSTGMHRMQAGHFTETAHVQILGLPVISKSDDLTTGVTVSVFTPVYGKQASEGPVSWTEAKPFGVVSPFCIIHDVKVLHGANNGLDMALLASKEGVSLIYYDLNARAWKWHIINAGLQTVGAKYLGTGSIDVCAVEDDAVGYLATCEAFHGNTVVVYVKTPDAPKGYESLFKASYWTRKVIDDFGPLPAEGTGTIHHVMKMTLPGQRHESFGIACMGAPTGSVPNQGVYLYNPTNFATWAFYKTKLTNDSAGRLAVGRYSGTLGNSTEVASLSYYVPGYHTGPDPPSLRINTVTMGKAKGSKAASPTDFCADILENEILLRIPHPANVGTAVPALPFWCVAGRKLNLLVLGATRQHILARDVVAIKVLYGKLENIGQEIAPLPHTVKSCRVNAGSIVRAGPAGAVFITLASTPEAPTGPFKSMDEVVSQNQLIESPFISLEVTQQQFPFIKVEDLSWGASGLWDGFEFYNATGFHIFFNNDPFDKICHMQAWTLGIGETARFHNHNDKSFGEIHFCLSNGGGAGGMRWFPDSYPEKPPIDTNLELQGPWVEENSQLIVVGDLSEHGPLWKIQPNTKWTPQIRPNATVDYPWHAWLASEFGDYEIPINHALIGDRQRYDVWLAFEFPPYTFQE